MVATLPDSRKDPVIQFISETESIRLTNWFIRITWKTAAFVVALTARLFASVFLTIARLYQRNRFRW